MLSLFVLVLGIRYGSFVAGGADSYGYVSEALLWQKGNLHVFQPMAAVVPWPRAIHTLCPLGYTPAGRYHLVPVYSPGLPLLMAAFRKALGAGGQFYVVPVLGALAIWFTFLLGRRLTGRSSVALSAAIVLATCSPFLFMLVSPMSDVPVAAAWTLALLLALTDGAAGGLACGIAAAVAVLIRPNLAPAGLVVFASLLWRSLRVHGVRPRALHSPVLFACGLVPGLVAVALINRDLYGSPFQSGYGNVAALYALSNVGQNLRLYPRWLIQSGCGYVLLGTGAAFVPWARPVREHLRRHALGSTRVLVVGFLLVVWLSYLFYQPFDAWWYLRFLLPIVPVTTVLAAALVAEFFDRLRLRAAPFLLIAIALVLFVTGYRTSRASGVFTFHIGEARYARAGDYVARHTDARAVIVSMQHSGSVRYYSDRTTVRYDVLDPRRFDEEMETLLQMRFHPYILLESWEVGEFKQRFLSQAVLGQLDWPSAEAAPGVRLWDVSDRFREKDRAAEPAPTPPRR